MKYKIDKVLEQDHQDGAHAEQLVFGCQACSDMVREIEKGIWEEQEQAINEANQDWNELD